MTILQQVEVVVIFMPYFRSIDSYAYCVWLLHKYEAHIKGLPICFSEVQVKNDVTDNNNNNFVTAFEGECRNMIELREHLKLCFLIILNMTTCITPFDQWDTFNDVTHQNIPRNRTGVVAEIPCVAEFVGGEWRQGIRKKTKLRIIVVKFAAK